MQQKHENNYPEAISMEEYLTKRKKIREQQYQKRPEGIQKENQVWALAEIYV